MKLIKEIEEIFIFIYLKTLKALNLVIVIKNVFISKIKVKRLFVTENSSLRRFVTHMHWSHYIIFHVRIGHIVFIFKHTVVRRKICTF